MLDFSRSLCLKSAASYFAWRLLRLQRPVTLRLKSGPRFELRPRSISNNNDYGVAYEIFVEKQYDDGGHLAGRNVNFVVDLGANVGFTTIDLLTRYPNARALSFEPHPSHGLQAQRNWRLA